MFLINGIVLILLGIIIHLLGRGILLSKKYKKLNLVDWTREIIHFLFVIYICMVFSVTLFPLPIGFHSNNDNINHLINIIPLVSIIEDINQIGIAYGGDAPFMIGLIARNVGGNILLFIPLGFLAPIVWNKFKHYRKVIILGFTMSFSIEVLQLIESLAGGRGRITDIDDIICNVLGAILGYLIFKFIFNIVDKYQIRIVKILFDGNSGRFDHSQNVD